MSDIFISYASADRERAKLLSRTLGDRGWSVWWDRTIPPGKEYDEVIEEALDSAKCVVVLWSNASVASSWVKTEAAEAMRRKILVPALIEETKIPLEFRRLQAADLSHWFGESSHSELEKFFQSLDVKIRGVGETGRDAIPVAPTPVQPRLVTQPGSWTRAVWPAVALIGALVGASSGLILWRSQQADTPGPPVPAQDMSPPSNPAPVVDQGVVGRLDPVSRPPVAPDPGAVDRPSPAPSPVSRQPAAPDPGVVDRPPPISRQPAARDPGVVDRPGPASRQPLPPDPGIVKGPEPSGPAPVAVKPVTPPAPPESPTTPTEATKPLAAAAASPKLPVEEFEEILLVVTNNDETEEQDAILAFGDTSLVVKDEDANILRTLPYSNVQKATYSRTQRRIMLVRTTRHRLTLGVGREEVVLQLPGDTYESILSQLEKRTGVTVVRRVE